MAVVDLVMPKLGESIMEATILKWHKKAGDKIEQDETVLDIATDKVDSEVPSTTEGTLSEILFNENDVVPIGAVIARIETGVAAVAEEAQPQPSIIKEEPKNIVAEPVIVESAEADESDEIDEVPYVPIPTPVIAKPQGMRFYSPLVLNIANSEGIGLSEMESIPGTGNDGRLSKHDILQYVEDKKAGKIKMPAAVEYKPKDQLPAEEVKPAAKPVETAPVYTPKYESNNGSNVEILEMDRMRKLIAKHMVDSVQTSPHVTSFSEADVTNMVVWRDKVKADFEKRENTKITFTPLFIDCLVRVIKRFPMINSSVEGDKIIIKKDINIGMATALPNGSLIVPVIRNADYLNLVGLSKQVNTLANNARNNKLKPDDTAGGTFTITNVGSFGSLMGTPIINQPQAAILAVGIIKKRPVVIETLQGDTIGIRHMMYLSLSYDHRIIDGSLGASFLTAVAKEFEKWDVEKSA